MGSFAPTKSLNKDRCNPVWVIGRRHTSIGIATGVSQIAADLLRRPSRQIRQSSVALWSHGVPEATNHEVPILEQPLPRGRSVNFKPRDCRSATDWALDAIEEALAARDTEVAAGKRKTDLERRLDMKYEAIVSVLAAGTKVDRTSTAANQRLELDGLAEGAIEKWRTRLVSDYRATPRTPLERLCREFCDIEDEIDGNALISLHFPLDAGSTAGSIRRLRARKC